MARSEYAEQWRVEGIGWEGDELHASQTLQERADVVISTLRLLKAGADRLDFTEWNGRGALRMRQKYQGVLLAYWRSENERHWGLHLPHWHRLSDVEFDSRDVETCQTALTPMTLASSNYDSLSLLMAKLAAYDVTELRDRRTVNRMLGVLSQERTALDALRKVSS